MSNFKYDANIKLEYQKAKSLDFDENSTITQIVNLQPMLVKWTNSEGTEISNIFNIDFYNEKVYNYLAQECEKTLLIQSIEEIIRTKKRNMLNIPMPDTIVQEASHVVSQIFESEIPCPND